MPTATVSILPSGVVIMPSSEQLRLADDTDFLLTLYSTELALVELDTASFPVEDLHEFALGYEHLLTEAARRQQLRRQLPSRS